MINVEPAVIIHKGNVSYDFSFAELAIKYLETDDSAYLQRISKLKATEHIFKHTKHFNYNVPRNSKIELVTYLLSPVNIKKRILDNFKENLRYAKENVAQTDLPQKICLQYLPKDFNYSSNLFFTFGYDLGVVYGKNSSVNLAHPHYLRRPSEIKYYSIHELHHAGFVMLKNDFMPSLDISNYKEMTQLIEYFTHLEGMGTFTALDIRKKERAINDDKDYVVLQDSNLMKEYEKEFLDIYFHFKNNPDKLLNQEDWNILSVLSNTKRLWYTVGAMMAETIDKNLGRDKLVGIISKTSQNFVDVYLNTKSEGHR
ncbi:MAG: hypothetical protein COA82_04005 [Alkaliphilus sp.]|nr:hypothetical protein [bacterium AH-315-E09]PHS35606.1 MAG: hypothetical protein COA82_04005 [Alkaliphilus sp.]